MNFHFKKLYLSGLTALASAMLLATGMAQAQSTAQRAVDAAKKE